MVETFLIPYIQWAELWDLISMSTPCWDFSASRPGAETQPILLIVQCHHGCYVRILAMWGRICGLLSWARQTALGEQLLSPPLMVFSATQREVSGWCLLNSVLGNSLEKQTTLVEGWTLWGEANTPLLPPPPPPPNTLWQTDEDVRVQNIWDIWKGFTVCVSVRVHTDAHADKLHSKDICHHVTTRHSDATLQWI